MAPGLIMKNINKSFPGVQALKNVSLEVSPGEVHVLVGENGAGKSTLVKILAGIYEYDSGEIYLNDRQLSIKNTAIANSLGIYIIHQELNLVPELSVAENIYLGRPLARNRSGLISWKALNANAKKVLDELSLNIDPKVPVKNLSVAQQQMIEIAKVISEREPRIIIMDEPTAAISETETKELFKQIKRLTKTGTSILYISHRLEEIPRIGDRLTVMRDGAIVNSGLSAMEITKDQIIQMMVGRSLVNQYPKKICPKGDEALKVEHMTIGSKPHDVTFSVHLGEVLGFAGLIGSGRTELMRAVFGADKKDSGQVYINGKRVDISSPFAAASYGIAFLTENRKEMGLLLNLPIYCNITLANLKQFSNISFINHKAEKSTADTYIQALKIKAPSNETETNSLSGGNQQKVILARWLCKNAKILILDEPTRGIDVGAKAEIYEIINALAKDNKAIIMISSDMPELIGMSDRIAVMCEGVLTGILERQDFSQEKIMQLAVKTLVE